MNIREFRNKTIEILRKISPSAAETVWIEDWGKIWTQYPNPEDAARFISDAYIDFLSRQL